MSWNPTHIQVTVQRARGLISKGKSGTNDVYATIGLGKEKYHTTTKEKATDPEWYEECDLVLPEKHEDAHIEIIVSHHNAIGIDEFLGRIELPLRNYNIHDPPRSQWHPLVPKVGHTKNMQRGEIEVRLCYIVGKMKDPDSISTASTASKRLKIGKKMLSHLGDRLHIKKREKTKDHIPDLTGLDEGVLDDDDIAENYSISVTSNRKISTGSHSDIGPAANVQSSPFTKFTPFPREKSDVSKSPTSSIASEEDFMQKHGDGESEHSFEFGKTGKGINRSSGGKPKKLSLGKRGLTSKDKSQSVWEISNTKSEFGLASGLRMTVGSSKEEGDAHASRRPPAAALGKDKLEAVLDVPKGQQPAPVGKVMEDPDLSQSKVKPSPLVASSSASSSMPLPDKSNPLATQELASQGTSKTGVLKVELKQIPMLVDDEDDQDDNISASATGYSGGIVGSYSTARDVSGASVSEAGTKPGKEGLAGASTVTTSSWSSGVPDMSAPPVRVHVQSSSADGGAPIVVSSKAASNAAEAHVPFSASGGHVLEAKASNPFLGSGSSAAIDMQQKHPGEKAVSSTDFVRKDLSGQTKRQVLNPFEESDPGTDRPLSIEKAPRSASSVANPFADDDQGNDVDHGGRVKGRGQIVAPSLVGSKADVEVAANILNQHTESKAKAAEQPHERLNPFEESLDLVASKPQASSVLSRDPPVIETVTLPLVDSNAKTVVNELSSKEVVTSRKVLASAQRAPLKPPVPKQPDVSQPSVSAVSALRTALTSVPPPLDEPPATMAAVSAKSDQDTSGSLNRQESMPGITGSKNPFEDSADHLLSSVLAYPKPVTSSLPAKSPATIQPAGGVMPFMAGQSKSKKVAPPPPVAVVSSHTTEQAPDSAKVAAISSAGAHSASNGPADASVQLHSLGTNGKLADSSKTVNAGERDAKAPGSELQQRVRSSTDGDSSERPAAGSKRNASLSVLTTDVVGKGDAVPPSREVTPQSSVIGTAMGLHLPEDRGKPAQDKSLRTLAVDTALVGSVMLKDENTSPLVTTTLLADSATQTTDVSDNIPQEYRNVSKEVLVEMVLKMKSQLTVKEGQVRDLEEYIDQLLLRVMDGNPALLLHADTSRGSKSEKR